MRRRPAIVATIVWTAVVLTWAGFLNGQVYMCLGPLNVTEESCRAAVGLPPLTDWDRFLRGWGPVAILLVAGWAAIAVVVAVVERWKRQRGGL